jgi:hypothetical protein
MLEHKKYVTRSINDRQGHLENAREKQKHDNIITEWHE